MKHELEFIQILNWALENPSEFSIKSFRRKTDCGTTYCFAGKLPDIDPVNWKWNPDEDNSILYIPDPDHGIKCGLETYFDLTISQINKIFYVTRSNKTVLKLVKNALEVTELCKRYHIFENKLIKIIET